MTAKVLVQITGLHYIAGIPKDEEADEIQVLCAGSFYTKNGIDYVIYEELLEGESTPVKNMLKIGEDFLEVTKRGAVQSHLIFRKGKVEKDCYCTPQGELNVEMDTEELEIRKTQDEISIRVSYGMKMNGMFVSDSSIEIRVQSTRETI